MIETEVKLLRSDLINLGNVLAADVILVATHPEIQSLDISLQRIERIMGALGRVTGKVAVDDVLDQIIRLKLGRIAARVAANHKALFEYDQGLVDAVLARCTEVDTGARAVDHILNGTLLPEIAESVLARMASGEVIARIKVGAGKDGRFKYTVK